MGAGGGGGADGGGWLAGPRDRVRSMLMPEMGATVKVRARERRFRSMAHSADTGNPSQTPDTHRHHATLVAIFTTDLKYDMVIRQMDKLSKYTWLGNF